MLSNIDTNKNIAKDRGNYSNIMIPNENNGYDLRNNDKFSNYNLKNKKNINCINDDFYNLLDEAHNKDLKKNNNFGGFFIFIDLIVF